MAEGNCKKTSTGVPSKYFRVVLASILNILITIAYFNKKNCHQTWLLVQTSIFILHFNRVLVVMGT